MSEEPVLSRDTEGPPGLPDWVKLFMIIAAALLLIALVTALVFGVEHGPGMH